MQTNEARTNDSRDSKESSFAQGLRELFSVDVRSLALLRIALSIIILVDLVTKFPTARLFCSDEGILTGKLAQEFLGPGYWSLYWLNGSGRLTELLMVLTGAAVVCFMLGFRTKWMNVICLVMIWSLQIRNPLVLTAGDILLRMMLFWMMFLPTASVWSVDSIWESKLSRRRWVVCSVASSAIMIQLAMMYFFSGIAKLNDFWMDGVALEYTLNLEMYVRPLGRKLLEFPVLIQLATFITLAAEIIGPVFLFMPRVNKFARGMMMALFLVLHLGVALTMSIGIFSAVAICAWLVFIPVEFWNSVFGEPIALGNGKPGDRKSDSGGQKILTFVCTVVLGYIILQNVSNAVSPAPNPLHLFGRATMTIQEFRMFGEPPVYSPWFEYVGTLEDGQVVELFSQAEKKPGEKPASVYGHMKSQAWRRLHWNLSTNPDDPPSNIATLSSIRHDVLLYEVDRWNSSHSSQHVKKAELICHLVPIRIGYGPDLPAYRYVWATYSVDQTE